MRLCNDNELYTGPPAPPWRTKTGGGIDDAWKKPGKKSDEQHGRSCRCSHANRYHFVSLPYSNGELPFRLPGLAQLLLSSLAPSPLSVPPTLIGSASMSHSSSTSS
jgi:hypothetical protein